MLWVHSTFTNDIDIDIVINSIKNAFHNSNSHIKVDLGADEKYKDDITVCWNWFKINDMASNGGPHINLESLSNRIEWDRIEFIHKNRLFQINIQLKHSKWKYNGWRCKTEFKIFNFRLTFTIIGRTSYNGKSFFMQFSIRNNVICKSEWVKNLQNNPNQTKIINCRRL